ncbi:MAG: response regulator [candidate division Zixibacteria bacterium]|nr:response regulator [candidate division Zixibacteria bacterium]
MPNSYESITILVIDDEKLIRDLLGETLGALGYTALTAEDFKGAVNILDSQSIDVVITDIMLPDKSGIELIELVKKNFAKTPVLAISGKNIPRQEILDAGADGFLAKPFRIGVVEEMIQKTLLQQDIERANPIPGRKKILVVDDEPDVVSTLIESLDALGYQAIGAANGVEALEIIEKDSFDLVITDIRMPEKNGIDLLKDIKSKFPDLPVVIITGYTLAYPPEQAKKEGAEGYIPKPFRINQIDELLAKILYDFEKK